MKKILFLASLIYVVAFVSGCTSKGSSAPAPSNVAVVAGDSSATVTWDMAPGVEYWIFLAPAAGVTPQNCSSTSGCQIITGATSPFVVASPYNGGTSGFTTNGSVTAMTNGTTFSLSINGRIDHGPGGPGSAAVSFVPRLAGTTWVAGSGIGATTTLRGVANGTATVAGVSGNVLLTAGDSGSLFSSTDGINWSVAVSGVPATGNNLNAAAAYSTTYLAAGQGGVIVGSPDALTWTQRTSGTSNDLYGLASNGGGGFVAVGAGGAILYSNGNSGTSWTAATSPTANALYGVAYANGLYVAVGQAGTLLLGSADGSTWTSVTPVTSADLKGVAYGGASTTAGVVSGVNTFVLVGNSGALVTSVDGGATWQAQPAITSVNLNSVAYGHQFVAVGDSGSAFTSLDGYTWQAQSSGSSTSLYAIARRNFDYSAVGAGGLTLSAR